MANNPNSPNIPVQLKIFEEQVGGTHYRKMKIQPTEYILANELDFCSGNIVKYASRWKDKNGIEDLQKIIQYAEILIEHEIEQNRLTEDCPKGTQ